MTIPTIVLRKRLSHRLPFTEGRKVIRFHPAGWMMSMMAILMFGPVIGSGLTWAGSIDRVQLQHTAGSVQLRRAGQVVPVTLPMGLQRGDNLSTGGNGRILIDLGKENFIELGPNAQLDLIKRDVEKDESLSLGFKLISGTLHSHTQQLAAREGLIELETNAGKLVIPGADFRVTVESADRVNVSVDDGLVIANALGKVTMIEAGYGTTISRSGPPAAPTKLPEQPRIISPAENQAGTIQSLRFNWQPPSPDFKSHFVVALDPNQKEPVISTVVSDPKSLNLSSLSSGKYFWSVASIDSKGIEGSPSKGRPITVIDKLISLPPRLHDTLVFLPPDGCLKFTWEGPPAHYRLRIAEDALFTKPLVDQTNLSTQSYQVRIPKSGEYFWQVQTVEYPISSPLAKLTVKTNQEFEDMFLPQNSVWSSRTNYIDKLRAVDVAANGKLAVVGVDVWSNLYAIDAVNGSILWKFTDAGSAGTQRYTNYTAPLVINSGGAAPIRIVYTNGQHSVFCVQGSDGTLLWKFQTDGDVHTTPSAIALQPNELPTVFVVDDTNTLYGINPADGSLAQKQKLTLLGKMSHGPALGRVGNEPHLIAASDGGNVADLAMDGTAFWKVNLDTPVVTTPVVVESPGKNTVVLVGTLDGHLVALSLVDGSRLWQYPDGPSKYLGVAQPVAAHFLKDSSSTQVVFGTNMDTDSKVRSGSVIMLDAATGKLVWEHPMSHGMYGSFAVADINLDGTPDVIGETGGTVNISFALSGSTGAPLFETTNEDFLNKANAVTSVIVQPTTLEQFPTVPSEASPTPLLKDLDGDGLLELVFLDHDFTGVTLYRTIIPTSAAAPLPPVPNTWANGSFTVGSAAASDVAAKQ